MAASMTNWFTWFYCLLSLYLMISFFLIFVAMICNCTAHKPCRLQFQWLVLEFAKNLVPQCSTYLTHITDYFHYIVRYFTFEPISCNNLQGTCKDKQQNINHLIYMLDDEGNIVVTLKLQSNHAPNFPSRLCANLYTLL